jgi:hypothetical protein
MNARVELFRRLALQLPEAVESSHMNHPDFRINGRIFATLSAQERGLGVLKLTVEQQQSFIAEQPKIFSPVQGGWGRMGMTFINLREANESVIAGALSTAYKNVVKKQFAKKSGRTAKSTKASGKRLQ